MPRLARVIVPGAPHHACLSRPRRRQGTQRGNNRQGVFFADNDRRAYLHMLAKQGARFDLRVLGYCLMTNHEHLIVARRVVQRGRARQRSGCMRLAGRGRAGEGVRGADRREELTRGDDPARLDLIRLRTRTGRPLGSDSFVGKLESALGRRLRALPIGRPRKRTAKQERGPKQATGCLPLSTYGLTRRRPLASHAARANIRPPSRRRSTFGRPHTCHYESE